MATYLQEILTGQEKAGITSVQPGHSGNCGCHTCRQGVPNSGHKNWRERRNERYARTPRRCTGVIRKEEEEEQFLGPVLRNAVRIGAGLANAAARLKGPAAKMAALPGQVIPSPVISIGDRQRKALLQYWNQEKQRTRNDALKKRYDQYIETIKKRQRPAWHQSEKDLQLFFRKLGMPGQRTFLNNQPAQWIKRPGARPVPPRNSVIPDINPADAMIEVKNYKIQNQNKLIHDLQQQIGRRMQQGPQDAAGNPLDQKVILDMRGQPATYNQLVQLARKVAGRTGLAPENVQVVTWEVSI